MTCTKCKATDKPIAWATNGSGKSVQQALCLPCLEKELTKIKESK